MIADLLRFLPDAAGTGGVRLWLKSSGYARRLLLGAEGDPWGSPAAFLAFFAQAHGLLRPDVAVVDVADLYRAWMRRHPDLLAAMGRGRRASVPLRRLLDEDGPRLVLAEVVEALLAHLRGRDPLVLAFPSPRAWLDEAKAAAGLGRLESDDDAIEDAAMYLADLLRTVSTQPISGVLFEEEDTRPIDGGDLVRYRPILNVAHHYRWGVVIRAAFAEGRAPDGLEPFAAAISAHFPDGPLPCAAGYDVGPAVWRGGRVAELAPGAFRFLEIPVEAKPETVLETLERLR